MRGIKRMRNRKRSWKLTGWVRKNKIMGKIFSKGKNDKK